MSRMAKGSRKSSPLQWVPLEDRQRSTIERAESIASPEMGENPLTQEERRKGRPTLVDAGRKNGESRVIYNGHNIPLHLLTHDFFTSVVNLDTYQIMIGVAVLYLVVFFVWSFIWWLIVRFYPGCLYGASNYVESLAFATVTQMTIGYGNTGPEQCWAATWLIIIQSILAIVLEAVVLGVVFARISHPHQRSRSIFMSNKAVVSRRDGILKFMFRVADIRTTQVVEPKVKAYLYTWGQGRITAEGERIPVRVEPLEVDYIDGMLLLPLIIEHTIDERSPLCGHTHTSLVALSAELVVTFEGTTEMGNPFMARRSYIPEEIYWGHQFKNVVIRPEEGASSSASFYEVNLDHFHQVERQESLPNVHPIQLSRIVVNRAKRTVPYPLLGENTLVLSDVLCISPNEDGELVLCCRVGDTYPNQMLEITAKMLLYRWKQQDAQQKSSSSLPGGVPSDQRSKEQQQQNTTTAPEGEAFEEYYLECGYETGTDRLHLRLPTLLTHVIDADSPLAAWREPGGVELDTMSEIVVVINAYMNVNNKNVLRQRTYTVNHHVRFGCGFIPIVKHPAQSRDGKPRVRWQHFHDVQRVQGMEAFPVSRGITSFEGGTMLMSQAPESHANIRAHQSIIDIQNPSSIPSGPIGGLASAGPSQSVAAYLENKLIFNLPNNGNYGADLERNDFTVLPMDLQRYAANVGGDASQVTGSPKASIGILFPEVMLNYSDDFLDASTSLPHAAALHPSLPGPDRFRLTDAAEEANDYTANAADLSRYSAAVGHSDSLPKQGGAGRFARLPSYFQKTVSTPGPEDGAGGSTAKPTTVTTAPTPTVERLGKRPSSSQDGERPATTKTGSAAPEPTEGAAAEGLEPSASINEPQVTIVAPGEQKNKDEKQEEGARSGPLYGVHPIERSTSYAKESGGGEVEEEAGPMHFATSKARQGAKSLKEISSLFSGEINDDDEEEEEDGLGAEAGGGVGGADMPPLN
ncbi:hypothetical protein Ndes2437B_g06780 [Nannochloris sp. 'desiccata']